MRICKRPTSLRTRRGNAVLEAALVLPILLGLAFGTVEFGYYFYIKHTLQGASRQGARSAIVSGATTTDVSNAVAKTMGGAGIAAASYSVVITDAATGAAANPATAASGDALKVSVSCTWGTVGIRPLGVIASDKQVVGFTVMVKE